MTYLLIQKAWRGSVASFMSNIRYSEDAVILLMLAVAGFAGAAWSFAKSERRRQFSITLWLSDRTSVRLQASSATEAQGLRRSVEQALVAEAER